MLTGRTVNKNALQDTSVVFEKKNIQSLTSEGHFISLINKVPLKNEILFFLYKARRRTLHRQVADLHGMRAKRVEHRRHLDGESVGQIGDQAVVRDIGGDHPDGAGLHRVDHLRGVFG